MASVLVTFRLMPSGPDVDLEALEKKCVEAITKFGALSTKVEQEPIAFGLKALKILFVIDEAKGDVEPLERQLAEFENVQSAKTTDVRRTFG
jgi:elongation factor 1-beta